jgi:hypothetical protein
MGEDLCKCVQNFSLIPEGKKLEELVDSGRAIAQAISRRLPIVTARVRARLRSYGICCEQSGT